MQEVERAMVRIHSCIYAPALIICLEASGDARVSMTSVLLEQLPSKQEPEDYQTVIKHASSVVCQSQTDVCCSSFRNLGAILFTSGGGHGKRRVFKRAASRLTKTTNRRSQPF